jgi:glycosyltransferase involved in cell wall biosynthesis
MLQGYKIVVVMPAYNAEQTLEMTYEEIPHKTPPISILQKGADRGNTDEVCQEFGSIKQHMPDESELGVGDNEFFSAKLPRKVTAFQVTKNRNHSIGCTIGNCLCLELGTLSSISLSKDTLITEVFRPDGPSH